ncbi:MAG: hypothetical protein ABIH72_04485 [archaeon]
MGLDNLKGRLQETWWVMKDAIYFGNPKHFAIRWAYMGLIKLGKRDTAENLSRANEWLPNDLFFKRYNEYVRKGKDEKAENFFNKLDPYTRQKLWDVREGEQMMHNFFGMLKQSPEENEALERMLDEEE